MICFRRSLKSSFGEAQVITDSKEFGTWFGMRLDGPFTADQPIKGVIACTAVDEEVARRRHDPSHVDGFSLEIVLQALDSTLSAYTGLFESTERHFVIHDHAVDRHATRTN